MALYNSLTIDFFLRADDLAALRRVRDEEQVSEPRAKRLGSRRGAASPGGPVLVQVQLHGGGLVFECGVDGVRGRWGLGGGRFSRFFACLLVFVGWFG